MLLPHASYLVLRPGKMIIGNVNTGVLVIPIRIVVRWSVHWMNRAVGDEVEDPIYSFAGIR